jgi:uncharacterized membrane protein HdeD (DUF308 family)
MEGIDPVYEETREATWGWWVLVLVGLISVIAGIVCIAKPDNSLATLAVIIGIFVLVDGIFTIVVSFTTTQNRGLIATLGVLSVVVGVLLIRHPIGGVTAVALILGIWLIAAGVVRFIAVFEFPGHRFWRLLVSLALMIAGIVIVSDKNIGYATLALIAGLGFIAYGLTMIALGWALHTIRQASTPAAAPPPA